MDFQIDDIKCSMSLMSDTLTQNLDNLARKLHNFIKIQQTYT